VPEATVKTDPLFPGGKEPPAQPAPPKAPAAPKAPSSKPAAPKAPLPKAAPPKAPDTPTVPKAPPLSKTSPVATTPGSPPPAETPHTLPAKVAPAVTEEIAQVVGTSGFRVAGRFLAREAPGLILQLVFMALFPPGVNIHNDKAEELSRTKFDPAVQDALAKLAPTIYKLLSDDLSHSIYANASARLDYLVDASLGGLELYLNDVTFLDMKISNQAVVQISSQDVDQSDPQFQKTGSKRVARQVTYSLLLYEPESGMAASITRAARSARGCGHALSTVEQPPQRCAIES
jgi:hypothetical protein